MTTPDRFTAQEVSGLLAPDGYLDRELPMSGWVVPPMTIRKDQLLWPQDAIFAPLKRCRPDRVPLESFVHLADADGGAILRFANRWGPLRICQHGLCQGHQVRGAQAGRLAGIAVATGMTGYCDLLRTDDGYYWEPLSLWRNYAARARALLNIVLSVRKGKPGSLEDWTLATGIPRIELKYEPPIGRLQADRMEVCARISSWMNDGRVRPYVSWETATPKFEFMSDGLYGALGLQLAAVSAGSTGFDICSSCGAYFPPRPHAVRGTRRYCGTCRDDGVPVRDAARARRARERQLKKRVAVSQPDR